MNLILTNPPMGMRVPVPDLRGLIRELFRVAATVLCPGGRLVFVNPVRMESPTPLLQLQSRQTVDLGGFEGASGTVSQDRLTKNCLRIRNFQLGTIHAYITSALISPIRVCADWTGPGSSSTTGPRFVLTRNPKLKWARCCKMLEQK